MNKGLIVAVGMLAASAAYAGDARKPADGASYFYVYHDKGDRQNHFIPGGWMGDYGDLKINDAYTADLAKDGGRTAIEWTYSAKGSQGANWTGVYWQAPANNWGDKPGGYDLSGFKRLTFLAKADRPIKVAEFKVGGLTGEHGDTDAVSIGPVDISQTWAKYTIDLADKNLSHIVGGFAWSASRDDNPEGFKLYLDEIRFER